MDPSPIIQTPPSIQTQGQENQNLKVSPTKEETNENRIEKVAVAILPPSPSVPSSPSLSQHTVEGNKNKISKWESFKTFFLKLFGYPVNEDLVKAKSIQKNIKELEDSLDKYSTYTFNKKTGQIGDRKEVKELIETIKDQAQKVKQQEGDARELGKAYSHCRSYVEQINKTYNYAKHFEYREKIIHDLQQIEETVGTKNPQLSAIDQLNNLKEKEKTLIDTLNEALKSDPLLKNHQPKQKKLSNILPNKKDVSIENAPEVIKIAYSGVTNPAFNILSNSKNLQPLLKPLIKRDLQSLCQTGPQQVALHAEKVKQELQDMTEKEREKLLNPFKEFIKTEHTFKENLEDLQAYKNKLDDIIDNPSKLQQFEAKLTKSKLPPLPVLEKLRDNLDQFAQVLTVIGPFSTNIDKLTIDQLPEFAQEYLKTDFTPFLNAIALQEQLTSLILANPEIDKLCTQIRKGPPKNFKAETDLNSLASTVFQRVTRYPMMLAELLKHSKDNSAVSEVVNQCHQHALQYAKAVNNW